MANVLIGIIGVILFIGIAVASGSYFGGTFLQANNSRNATIALASLRQMSDAIHAYRMVARADVPNTSMFANNLIANNNLKVAPANPNRTDAPTTAASAGAWPYPIYANGPGNNAVFTSSVNYHDYLVMDLGQTSAANATCIGFQKAVGSAARLTTALMATSATLAAATLSQPASGCFRASSGVPGAVAGDYVAYLRD